MFDSLPVLDPNDVDRLDADGLAGRSHPHELALMRAVHRQIGCHFVALRHEERHVECQIRECRPHRGEEFLQTFFVG